MSTHSQASIVKPSLAGMPNGVDGFLKNIATEVYSVHKLPQSDTTFLKKIASEVYEHKDLSKLSANLTKQDMSFLHNVADKVYAKKALAPSKKMVVVHHTPDVAAPKVVVHAAPMVVTAKPETALQK